MTIIITKLENILDYDTKFANQVLEAHNYYRTLHRAPPLALDEEVCLSYTFLTPRAYW